MIQAHTSLDVFTFPCYGFSIGFMLFFFSSSGSIFTLYGSSPTESQLPLGCVVFLDVYPSKNQISYLEVSMYDLFSVFDGHPFLGDGFR